jgi:hypothetical protein
MSGICDLRVAILGNKNVGKATVLYALMGRNYAGSKIITKTVEGAKPDIITIEAMVGMAAGDKENEHASVLHERPVSLGDGVSVNEITYRAAIPEPIVPMRDGSIFVFSILPPPSAGDEYKTALIQKWDSFDAILFVIDTKKGASDEDIDYLKVVQEQHSKTRAIPVIVVCNKVDDKENEKIAKNLKKAKSKVKKVFQVSDDDAGVEADDSPSTDLGPVICSVQAQKALTFRAGSKMTVYEFEDFDKDLMALIGKEKLGKDEWKSMSHEDRFRYTHEHVAGKKAHKDGMSKCGFDKVMKQFEAILGGASNQKNVLQARIDRLVYAVRPLQNDWISYSLFTAYTRQSALLSNDDEKKELEERSSKMRSLFWKLFDEYQAATFLKFKNAFPQKIKVVADPLQELEYYYKLVEVAKWDSEEDVILERQKTYVKQYLTFLAAKEHELSGCTTWEPKAATSPSDWCSIFQSILLLSYDPYFCDSFGKFKIKAEEGVFQAQLWKATKMGSFPEVCPHCIEHLDETKQKPVHMRCKGCTKVFIDGPLKDDVPCGYCAAAKVGPSNAKCDNCKYEHEILIKVADWHKVEMKEDGTTVPLHEQLFTKIVHVEVPENVNDPDHFGHPIFKASSFAKAIKEGKKKREEINIVS